MISIVKIVKQRTVTTTATEEKIDRVTKNEGEKKNNKKSKKEQKQ